MDARPLPVAGCSLTPAEARRRAEAFERLRSRVRPESAGPDRIVLAASETADAAAIESLLAAERECCPFIRSSFDRASGRIELAIDDPRHRSALAAFAEVLTG